MGSIHLFTLLEPSPGSGHSKTEWSSTEHVQEGALALDLCLEAKGKDSQGLPMGSSHISETYTSTGEEPWGLDGP